MPRVALCAQQLHAGRRSRLYQRAVRSVLAALVSVLMLAVMIDVTAIATVLDLGLGTSPAVALNRYRYPVIVYSSDSLVLATCSDLACPSVSTASIPGTSGSSQPALVLTSADQPVISYYNASSRDLMLAVCSTAACTSAAVSVVDSAGDVGQYSSIRLTRDGLPVISYYDATNRDLKAAFCGNLLCTSRTLQRIDHARDVGQYTSLALNQDGRAVISYYNASNQRLQLAVCNNPTCSNRSIKTIDSSGDVGQHTSLALTSRGRPVISYYDVSNGDLKLAICNNTACTHPSLRTVDRTGTAGQYTALTLDLNDRAAISYYANSPAVARLVECQNTLCTRQQRLDLGAGMAAGTAVVSRNPQGVYAIYVNDRRRVTLHANVPTTVGCSVDAPAVVDEGAVFAVTVRCDSLTAQVYGFEIALQTSSNLRSTDTAFAPGTFVSMAGANILEGVNRLDGYAVSRRSPALASTGSFSLGSVEYAAPQVQRRTSVTLTLSRLLLGDRSGSRLNVPVSPAVRITIRDTD